MICEKFPKNRYKIRMVSFELLFKGKYGESIKKLRDSFPNISIPEEKQKSDQITLRDPKMKLAVTVAHVKISHVTLKRRAYQSTQLKGVP